MEWSFHWHDWQRRLGLQEAAWRSMGYIKDILAAICLGSFIFLPMVLLVVRAVQPSRMPWWVVIFIMLMVGWMLVFGASVVAEMPDHGASKVFALFFGWVYAIGYFLPWLCIYGFVQRVRMWCLSRVYPQTPVDDRPRKD
jgi:hypothetical protein